MRAVYILFLLSFSISIQSQNKVDYFQYHNAILTAEELIAVEKYEQALAGFEKVFNSYDFVFLKDYKIATHLANHIGHTEKAFHFLELAISSGWTLKEIKKNKILAPLKDEPQWKN